MLTSQNMSNQKGNLEENATSFERFWFASVCILIISPAISAAIWAVILYIAEIHEKVPTSTIIFTSSLVSLVAIITSVFKTKFKYIKLTWVIAVIAIACTQDTEYLSLIIIPLVVSGLYVDPLLSYIIKKLPTSFDGRAKVRPILATLWLLTALMAVGQTTRLGVFIVEPAKTQYSLIPGVEWFERHNCLTGYVYATRLASLGADNIYDTSIVETDPFTTPLPHHAEDMAPFTLDGYLYAPTFLLLPKLFTSATTDFNVIRSLWFAFSLITMAISLLMLMTWLKGPVADQMFKLMPMFWGAMPVIMTLQIGGSQIVVLFALLIAMISLEKKHIILGSSMLSFIMLTKLWPALLVFPLIFQRRFRELAYISGFSVLFCLLVFAVFDAKPWQVYFNYILPKISDGSAFVMIDESIVNLASNFSPIGIPFKLEPFGITAGWEEAKIISLLYTAFLLVLSIFVAKRMTPGDRVQNVCLWLSLIVLGTLRSPLAPMHILIGFLLLMVVLSHLIKSKWHIALFSFIWLVMTILAPPENAMTAMTLSLVRQLILFTVLLWVVVRFSAKKRTEEIQVSPQIAASSG